MENNNELVDMLQVYFECQKNSVRAQRLYADRFPDRIAPNRRKFGKLEQRLRRTGRLIKAKGNRRVRNENLELDVLLNVEERPQTSIREIASNTNACVGMVHHILRKHKLRPYKVRYILLLTFTY